MCLVPRTEKVNPQSVRPKEEEEEAASPMARSRKRDRICNAIILHDAFIIQPEVLKREVLSGIRGGGRGTKERNEIHPSKKWVPGLKV